MKLPFLTSEKQLGEIYCGILLKESHGVCYVYEKNTTSVTLLKQKEFRYSDGWERIVDDIDEALSLIEQDLGKQTIITQCVFFIFAHLIDQNTHEIAKPYISKLRDISKLLELKPVGYMEVIDAVHEELEQQKQTRLSSIVVELDDTQMTVFLFKGGHKLVVQTTARTSQITEDMQASLEKIAQNHVLPNHIYLYDSTDLASESADLLLYSWKKNLFIQQPRIAVIPASQISTSLLKLLEKQLCEKPLSSETKNNVAQPDSVLGFTIGHEEEQGEIYNEPHEKKPFQFKFNFPTFVLPAAPKGLFIPIVSVFLAVSLLGGGLLYFFHTATIILKQPTVSKNAEMAILAAVKPTKSDQFELQTLLSPFKTNEKKETTGKKDIGEKATGEVTLYSYEEKERQLAKGTKLQVNSVSFETDDTVSIPASQFAPDGITKNPGKAKTKVRAIALGSESNIEKNKRFSVSDISQNNVFGINEGPITGGTKKTVRTISKSDMDNIKSFALDKAKQDALNKRKGETAFLLLPELSSAKATKEEFSGEVGEEADVLRYVASGEISLSQIPKGTIKSFVEKKLESEKPLGYKTNSVTFTIKKQTKLETGEMKLVVGGEAKFSKIIDTKELARTLSGKSVIFGQQIITSQTGIQDVVISIKPKLPFIETRLPFPADHIRIELSQLQ